MKKYLVILPFLALLLFNVQTAKADSYDDGINAYRSGNYRLAAHHFREAIKINPINARYRYYLGITLVQQGDIFEAEKQYKKVLDIAPGSEAAEKAQKGLALIEQAKQNLASKEQPTPTAMTSVLQNAPTRIIIPVHKDSNAIIVPKVLVNNKLNANFILDTGATYTSISRNTANKLGLDLKKCDFVALKTANGIIKVPRITLKTVDIGGLVANDVVVTVHDLPAAKNVTGLLGLSFLEKFTVTIDRKNNKVIIEK